MNTLSSLQVELLVQLVERKILCMMDEELFEKGEIQLLKDCRDHLLNKTAMDAKHLEHAIDLVEIRILCAAADGGHSSYRPGMMRPLTEPSPGG